MMKIGDSISKRDELIDKMDYLSIEDKKVQMSPDEKRIMKKGDIGQADRLKEQKRQYANK
jgi:hypothetical protein